MICTNELVQCERHARTCARPTRVSTPVNAICVLLVKSPHPLRCRTPARALEGSGASTAATSTRAHRSEPATTGAPVTIRHQLRTAASARMDSTVTDARCETNSIQLVTLYRYHRLCFV